MRIAFLLNLGVPLSMKVLFTAYQCSLKFTYVKYYSLFAYLCKILLVSEFSLFELNKTATGQLKQKLLSRLGFVLQ